MEYGSGSEIELEPMVGQHCKKPEAIALAEPTVRRGFVQKVYGILAVQLMVTSVLAGIVVCFGRQWLTKNPSAVTAAVTASCVLSLILACVFACCPEVMRRSPGNYGLLALFTVAESVLVGFACLQYTVGSVLLCMGLTALVVLGLTIYAVQTKTDMTSFGPYLLCGMLVMTGTGLMLMLMASMGGTHNAMFSTMQVLYAAGGALFASVFLVYDTQLIVGGNHEHEFSIDDYVMAAICLYLDIIRLFLSLLRLLGSKDDNGL